VQLVCASVHHFGPWSQDLTKIFDTLEGLPSLPGKLFGGIASWARGEQDPTWKKKGKKAPDSKRPW
jgi:hypothetical protein